MLGPKAARQDAKGVRGGAGEEEEQGAGGECGRITLESPFGKGYEKFREGVFMIFLSCQHSILAVVAISEKLIKKYPTVFQ